ncbi:unnamed protein product [Rotaria magnacalcarata]|uniref:Uncharacterized protein n=1 Tax=Rotaria magnacalcarata TaxID=392030 RepID=A0A820D3V3_9BILA|nr:unnamed protein product [Rotaria magnacalcarata]
MNLISLSSSSSSSIVQMEFGLFSSSLSTTSVEYGSSGSTITTEAESGSSSIIIIETERGSSSSSTIIIEQTRAIISQEKNNSSLISLRLAATLGMSSEMTNASIYDSQQHMVCDEK